MHLTSGRRTHIIRAARQKKLSDPAACNSSSKNATSSSSSVVSWARPPSDLHGLVKYLFLCFFRRSLGCFLHSTMTGRLAVPGAQWSPFYFRVDMGSQQNLRKRGRATGNCSLLFSITSFRKSTSEADQ